MTGLLREKCSIKVFINPLIASIDFFFQSSLLLKRLLLKKLLQSRKAYGEAPVSDRGYSGVAKTILLPEQ